MGDVAKGAKIFKTKCAQCHVVGKGEGHKQGKIQNDLKSLLVILIIMINTDMFVHHHLRSRAQSVRAVWQKNWSSSRFLVLSGQREQRRDVGGRYTIRVS